jgi:hypothetical protein
VSARPSPTLVCAFRTGEEWRRSAYARRGEGCTDRHMRGVRRPIEQAGALGQGRRHSWSGPVSRRSPASPLPCPRLRRGTRGATRGGASGTPGPC